MQEMLLQSWGNRLRIFPAAPKAWSDIQFDKLRGEGAFLVSARREDEKTRWAMIEAEVAGSVEVDAQITEAQWLGSKGVTVKDLGQGVYQVTSPAGGQVVFWPKGEKQPDISITPVETKGKAHRFGRS